MAIQGLSIKCPAGGIFQWRDFCLQKGAIYGTFGTKASKKAFVYLGQKRRETRPDGTKAGWIMKLYVRNISADEAYFNESQSDHGWRSMWVKPTDRPEYGAIFAKSPKVQFYNEPEWIKGGERNLLAYIPKQKDLGFIYNMVRERQ